MTRVVLTIGGSDCGGGAGIQADIKTFSALGLHGTSVLTAITAQNTLGVQQVFGLEPEAVLSQLRSITDDFTIAAAKTGMLYSAQIVRAVAHHLQGRHITLVVDPVIEAEAGGRLLRPEAAQALKEHLLPLADVVTPNIFEARALCGVPVRDRESSILAAGKILDMGPKAVIIKGGHLDCTDLLATHGSTIFLPGSRVPGENHGVGCTYSAALTSFLACGCSKLEAARRAKRFAENALRGSMRVGRGVGPVSQAAHLRHEAECYRVICNIQEATDRLLQDPAAALIIPDSGMYLGMAVFAAGGPQDVAELEGGLTIDSGPSRHCGWVRFGRRSLLSGVILSAQETDPGICAALTLSPRAWPACLALGLLTANFPEQETGDDRPGLEGIRAALQEKVKAGGRLPDAFLENIGKGRKGRLWLLGSSAGQLAGRALKIAAALRDGKI